MLAASWKHSHQLSESFGVVRLQVFLFIKRAHHAVYFLDFMFPALHSERISQIGEQRMIEMLIIVQIALNQHPKGSFNQRVINMLLLTSGKTPVNRHLLFN